MELMRVTNLLSNSVGLGGVVIHPRVDGDATRPGYRDLPAKVVQAWLKSTNRRPVELGWVKVEEIGGVAKAAPTTTTTTMPAVGATGESQEASAVKVQSGEENNSEAAESQGPASDSAEGGNEQPEAETPKASKTPAAAKRSTKKA